MNGGTLCGSAPHAARPFTCRHMHSAKTIVFSWQSWSQRFDCGVKLPLLIPWMGCDLSMAEVRNAIGNWANRWTPQLFVAREVSESCPFYVVVSIARMCLNIAARWIQIALQFFSAMWIMFLFIFILARQHVSVNVVFAQVSQFLWINATAGNDTWSINR